MSSGIRWRTRITRAAFLTSTAAVLVLAAGAAAQPMVTDPELKISTVVTGLAAPTTMAFLGPGEFLVLERDTGRVRRVLNGQIALPDPVLTVPVHDNFAERGLLGIAIDAGANPKEVFLYYTRDADGNDVPEANRLARFAWNAGTGTLGGETVLRDLPVMPGPNHNAGVIARDAAGLLYVMTGDLNRDGHLQNNGAVGAALPDDTSVILRLDRHGSAVPGFPLTPYCSGNPAHTCNADSQCMASGAGTCQGKVASYFAYGIRNGFGMAFDPATGRLWDTENGPGGPAFDEINVVAPGFNSGWRDFMGPQVGGTSGGGDGTLFVIPGSAYSDPEFSWRNAVAPTAILFPFGSNLGAAYDGVALVADVNNGFLYRLPLNGTRDGFDFSAPALLPLADLVADDAAERDLVRLGTGFLATDLELGPDGDVYVVSIAGAVYRISNPYDFFTVAPCRAVDTRAGMPLANGVERTFTIEGTCGVPATARALSVNLTVVGPTGGGHVTVYPGNLPAPTTSSLNFAAAQTRSNNAILPLATDGAGTMRALAMIAGGGTVDFILDVVGYFQ